MRSTRINDSREKRQGVLVIGNVGTVIVREVPPDVGCRLRSPSHYWTNKGRHPAGPPSPNAEQEQSKP